jgi:hypothetical protein
MIFFIIICLSYSLLYSYNSSNNINSNNNNNNSSIITSVVKDQFVNKSINLKFYKKVIISIAYLF